MSRQQVAITGLGVVSPFGLDVGEYYEALASGAVAIKANARPGAPEEALTSWYAPVEGFVAEDWMSPQVSEGSDRFTHFALAATQMALADAGLTDLDPERTAIVIGTAMGGTRALMRAQHLLETGGAAAVPRKVQIQIWPNMAAAQIAMKYQLHGPSMTICTACAASIDAVGTAARMIQAGMADVAITGGAEGGGDLDFLPATSVGSWTYGMSSPTEDARLACRPFDRDRTGIAGGEGSGFMILESLEHAHRRGADVKGLVAGYGSLADAFHPSSPDPTGRWEALVMRRAIEDAALPEERKVAAVYAHGTGTPAGDTAEIRAINDVYGDRGDDLLVTSMKGAIGHTGGSAASMNLVAGIEGMQRGGVLPTACTTNVDPEAGFTVVLGKAVDCDIDVLQFNAFGFGGQNASMIITRP